MSQAGLVDIEGSHPQIPTEFIANVGTAVPIANTIELLGEVIAADSNPFRSVASGNTVTYQVQTSQAIASTDATKIGLSAFDSGVFTVDANGFVSLIGGGAGIERVNVQTGTTPISPTGGNITINGATVAAGTNPVRTDGTGVSTMAVEVQRSQAIAATDATKIGLSVFDSAAFDVDANGFVQLNGGGIATTAFDVQANTAPGTDPVVPTAAGVVVVNGAAVANHSVVLETRSRAANAYNVEVQYATSAAATDATKSGVAHFDSARFSVDANGFVTLNGSGAAETITGDSGGALSPTAGNWNIIGGTVVAGTSPLKTAGSGSTLTINAQRSQAIASTDATKIGLAVFDSAAFDVDANGFVQLNGGGIAATSFTVDANTAPGTNPVVPTAAGGVTIEAAAVAAHSVPIETRSRAANTFKVEVQEAAAVAATDATKSGISHFDSARFTVDANGFVSANGSGLGETITGQSGGALSPSSGNWNINGATVAAGTAPLVTAGSGNTLTINAQRSQAIASADATKVGLSNFNSAQFSVDANGFVSATGTIPITTTENSGTATPSAGNLNILGPNSALTGYSPWTTGSGSTATVNMPGTVKWVVNATANLGTHTTIQAAITAASSGDDVFITPGTYTENLTLKAGVNLTAYRSDSSINGTGSVIISGTCTLTGAGTVSISGIQLQTNSAALLAVTGSAASIVNLIDCYLNCSNTTGITFSSSSASAQINIDSCYGNIGTTGISLFSHSSAGALNIIYSEINNSGSSTTASTVSAGSLITEFTYLTFPITLSSTGACSLAYTDFNLNTLNTTCLTAGGSGSQTAAFCRFYSGTASAISVSQSLTVNFADIRSSNTNAVTGAGTLVSNGILYSGTSHFSNVTTQTGGAASGLTQGTAPSAGFIGEQIRATVDSSSGVSLTTTAQVNVTSISLTAGIWDVSAVGVINNTGSATVQGLSISTTSATVGISGDSTVLCGTVSVVSSSINSYTIPSYRITLSATTTVYLVATSTFTTGTSKCYGRISATRVG